MLKGKSLQELAVEIDRQKNAKADFLADTRSMSVIPTITGMELNLHGEHAQSFNVNDIAHGQIGQKLAIPARYYNRLMETHPDMLSYNINELFRREPSKQMIRTLDGNARAFLSERYRAIDNDIIAEAVLPVLADWASKDGAVVESAEITDTKMYIKVVLPQVQAELNVGDVVQSGLVISNSEVGHGSVSVAPLVYRLVCSNGMIANDARQRKIHVGRVNESGNDFVVYRDETIEADNNAFIMKLQDTVRSAADVAHFERIVDTMRSAQRMEIEADVPQVVQVVTKNSGLTETEGKSVLDHLIRGGDLSLFGVSSAVTRFAQDVDSYDRSTELESIGWEICAITPAAWKQINAQVLKAG